jgi:GNAT superfamily N-acetyltransferase
MPIIITEERPDTVDALQLLTELDAQLAAQPYPSESRHAFNVEKRLRENVAFFVVRQAGQPAACGGVKLFGQEYGEVKRMFVRPAFRGLGLGKALLSHLAAHALAHKVNVLRLETGLYQTEAIGLYERYGFVRRPPFGNYAASELNLFFEKHLG